MWRLYPARITTRLFVCIDIQNTKGYRLDPVSASVFAYIDRNQGRAERITINRHWSKLSETVIVSYSRKRYRSAKL